MKRKIKESGDVGGGVWENMKRVERRRIRRRRRRMRSLIRGGSGEGGEGWI